MNLPKAYPLLIVLYFFALCFLMFLVSSGEAAHGINPKELVSDIRALRTQAKYDQAKVLASQLSGFVHASKDARPYQVEDADRQIATLDLITRLPRPSQREMAEADSLTSVVERFMYQWRFADALNAAARQLEIRLRYLGPRNCEVAEIHHQIGVILHLSDRRLRAAEELAYALKLRRQVLGNMHPAVASTLIQLARALRGAHEPDSALAMLDEAEGIVEATVGDDDLVSAALYHAQGLMSRRQQPFEEVERLYKKALDIRIRHLGRSHPETIDNICWLAHVAEDYGRLDEAEQLLKHARDLVLNCEVEGLGILAPISGALGGICWRKGALNEAEALIREAIKSRNEFRVHSPLAFGLQRYYTFAHGTLAEILLQQGRGEEAWEVLEAGTGWIAETLAFLHRRKEADGALAARLDSLEARVLSSERMLAVLECSGDRELDDEVLLATENIRLQALKAEAAIMLIESNLLTGEFQSARNHPNLELVQSCLDPQTAVVGWFRWGKRNFSPLSSDRFVLWGYIIRKYGPVRWIKLVDTTDYPSWDKLLGPLKEARASIYRASAWPQRVSRDRELERLTQEVCNLMFAPLLPYLENVSRLIITTDELQDFLPLECLVDGDGNFLLDTYTISYIPSIALFVYLSKNRSSAGVLGKRPALIVGDPAYGSGEGEEGGDVGKDPWESLDVPLGDIFQTTLIRGVLERTKSLRELPRLPMSRREAERIAALFDISTLLVGKSATENRLNALKTKTGFHGFGTIHFATHALVHPFEPERSSIALAPSDRAETRSSLQGLYYGDGLITTREILFGWDLDADVVTLSGCQTGKGPKSTGEGSLGFHQALLGAGARTIVTSAWEVDDVATALLMGRFYENLTGSYKELRNGVIGQPLSRADALREAKLWLKSLNDNHGRNPFEHPAYWAGFVLVGDPN